MPIVQDILPGQVIFCQLPNTPKATSAFAPALEKVLEDYGAPAKTPEILPAKLNDLLIRSGKNAVTGDAAAVLATLKKDWDTVMELEKAVGLNATSVLWTTPNKIRDVLNSSNQIPY